MESRTHKPLTQAEKAFYMLLRARAAAAITEEWNVATQDMADCMADVPGYVLRAWLRHTTAVVGARSSLWATTTTAS